jgi:SAM-dependent methyltransferase
MSLARKYAHSVRHQLSLGGLGLRVARSWKLYAEFLSPAYQQHNVARLQHLDSLSLPLACKSVLELGAGVGDHTLFYLYRNCRVLAVDGRPECVNMLKQRLAVDAQVIDLDKDSERIVRLGRFDLVHCYGLLYHLADPQRFLLHVSKAGDTLLLETCVSCGTGSRMQVASEASAVPSQALHGIGCRPSREWIFETLKLYYPFVYATRTQPRHPEFPIDWTALDPQSPGLKRAVFVASHKRIANPNLLTELPQTQVRW